MSRPNGTPPNVGPPPLLTIPEVAHQLRVGRDRVYALVHAGELESVHLGRSHRIKSRSLEDYLARAGDE